MNNWQQCSNVGEEALKSFDITRMNKKPSTTQPDSLFHYSITAVKISKYEIQVH